MIPQKLAENFNNNLASIPELQPYLAAVIENLNEKITADKEKREQRNKLIADAVKVITGETDASNKVKPLFPGGSTVGSSIFTESWLNTVNSVSSELLPPAGPCKTEIYGEATDELNALADRKKTFLNYFYTQICTEFKPELTRTVMWSVAAGDGFVKVYYHPILNRPTVDCIKPQDLILPEKAKTIQSASRITQILTLSSKELKQRVASGMYADVPVLPNDNNLENDAVDIAIAKGDRVSPDSLSDNSDHYTLHEVQTDINIKMPGFETEMAVPYIITYDVESLRPLSCYTNFRPDDSTFSPIQRIAHFPFITGFSAYGYGMAHLALNLSEASSALLRQSIDINTLNNLPSGFYPDSVRLAQNEIQIEPLKYKPISNQGMPINEILFQNEFQPLNPVSLQLKEILDQSIARLAASTEISPDEFPGNMPVASALALIDSITRPQGAIIQNYHSSLKEVFAMVDEIFRETLGNETYPYIVQHGENYLIKDDFEQNVAVVPVSDPNLSSQMQRVFRAQAIMEQAIAFPQLHDMTKVLENYYQAINVPNYKNMLVHDEEIAPQNPVQENMNMLQGKPAKAALYQDDDAHIATHQIGMLDPNLDDQKKALFQAHTAEHVANKFFKQVQGILEQQGIQLPPPGTPMSPDEENFIAQNVAPIVQQMQAELMQAMGQGQQPSPDYELMKENLELTAQYNKVNLELKEQEIELKHLQQVTNSQIKAKELQLREKEVNWRIEKEALEVGAALNMPDIVENAEQEEREIDLPLTGDLEEKVFEWELPAEEPPEPLPVGEEMMQPEELSQDTPLQEDEIPPTEENEEEPTVELPAETE